MKTKTKNAVKVKAVRYWEFKGKTWMLTVACRDDKCMTLEPIIKDIKKGNFSMQLLYETTVKIPPITRRKE